MPIINRTSQLGDYVLEGRCSAGVGTRASHDTHYEIIRGNYNTDRKRGVVTRSLVVLGEVGGKSQLILLGLQEETMKRTKLFKLKVDK